MDFGALPPEINSARIYAGPGAGPTLAAATAWDQLADELYSAAVSYHSVVTGLTTGPWLGQASAAMAAAAAPHVTWLTTTATHAEQTAHQARTAAAAYEAALSMTVPPPLVAANRALLMSLIATNVLGQNTPAIAATEAHYAEMWAQDAAAMYGYAANSAAAATLTPFTPPQQTTSPGALAGQAAALAQATGTSAATNTQAALSQAMSALPTALQGFASPLSSTSATSSLSSLNSALSSLSPALSMTSSAGWISSALLSNANQLKSLMPGAAASNTASGSALVGGLSSATSAPVPRGLTDLASAGGGAAVSAGMGRAGALGALSVPQSWASAAHTTSSAAPVLPGLKLGAAPTVAPAEPAGMLGGLPLATSAGRGTDSSASRPGPRITVIQRPPTAG